MTIETLKFLELNNKNARVTDKDHERYGQVGKIETWTKFKGQPQYMLRFEDNKLESILGDKLEMVDLDKKGKKK